MRCPLLIQVAERDSIAATPAAAPTAERAPRAELVRYPIAHFDIYLGDARERAIADQLDFLHRHLAPTQGGETGAGP